MNKSTRVSEWFRTGAIDKPTVAHAQLCQTTWLLSYKTERIFIMVVTTICPKWHSIGHKIGLLQLLHALIFQSHKPREQESYPANRHFGESNYFAYSRENWRKKKRWNIILVATVVNILRNEIVGLENCWIKWTFKFIISSVLHGKKFKTNIRPH